MSLQSLLSQQNFRSSGTNLPLLVFSFEDHEPHDNIGNTNSRMSGRTYVERDSRGRERLVYSRSGSQYRSSSQGRTPVRDLLEQAESREEALAAEVRSLQSRLSLAQRAEWHLQNLRYVSSLIHRLPFSLGAQSLGASQRSS